MILHSGGGSSTNEKLDNAATPVLWMANEAFRAGLKLEPSAVEWKWPELETSKPTESMNWFWRLVELIPIGRLSYGGRKRVIQCDALYLVWTEWAHIS